MKTENPYLCVHRSEFVEGMYFPTIAESWTVTHIPSGAAALSNLPSLQVANAVASWLSVQLDWSGDFYAVSKSAPEAFKLQIKSIRIRANEYVDSVLNIMDLIGALPKDDSA